MAICRSHLVSALMILVCALISFLKYSPPPVTVTFCPDSPSVPINFLSSKANIGAPLHQNYYRNLCPEAEGIIQAVVAELFILKPRLAPALLRMVFHDCFIEGCDASVLLDASEGVESEKTARPNQSLKGFEAIEIIKAEVERACPGVVSCADILVLATRDAVVLAGGPHYDLLTGRRDSPVAFHDMALLQLPPPTFNLSQTLSSFASRGFTVREIVSLLGSHSIGSINCLFFQNRTTNFLGTGRPDPTLSPEFLKQIRDVCNVSDPPTAPAPPAQTNSAAPIGPFSFSVSPAPAPLMEGFLSSLRERGMSMSYHHDGVDFGLSFYKRLLEGKGIIFSDQQLTEGTEAKSWITTYATNSTLYQEDFAAAMVKLSNLGVLTAPAGQIRQTCSKSS